MGIPAAAGNGRAREDSRPRAVCVAVGGTPVPRNLTSSSSRGGRRSGQLEGPTVGSDSRPSRLRRSADHGRRAPSVNLDLTYPIARRRPAEVRRRRCAGQLTTAGSGCGHPRRRVAARIPWRGSFLLPLRPTRTPLPIVRASAQRPPRTWGILELRSRPSARGGIQSVPEIAQRQTVHLVGLGEDL